MFQFWSSPVYRFSIISTRQNMNALLGSMQTLDRVIFAMQEERKDSRDQQNQQ